MADLLADTRAPPPSGANDVANPEHGSGLAKHRDAVAAMLSYFENTRPNR
jgi:hypothetical protein